ncbi:methionine aminopeptidase [Rhodovulum sulfidophilum]|uniref:Methionine aminopeptidase n=1 Tax=Rhodovulum sulfidophilum TaxID=35806 RepID=A0A0D6B6P2_RHOSU|nr:methionine aminopeptidase [Rhodovulum sulfidophilum]
MDVEQQLGTVIHDGLEVLRARLAPDDPGGAMPWFGSGTARSAGAKFLRP